MHERLKIVIVGENRLAAQLITDFMSRSFVEVVAVAGLFDDSPGAVAACRLGICFTSDIPGLSRLAPDPDLVIDMADWPGVDAALRIAYPGAADGSPTLVHDASTRLILGLAADSQTPIAVDSPSLVAADC